MGIQDLTSHVINADEKKGRLGLNYEIAIADLAGKKIWVDMNSVFFSYWNAVVKNHCEKSDLLETGVDFDAVCLNWKLGVLRVADVWRAADIKLTFVVDGVAPADKIATQDSRRRSRQKYMTKVSECVKEACGLCGVVYKEETLHTGELVVPIQHAAKVEELRKVHRLSMRACIDPIKENWTQLQDALTAEGYDVIKSNVEAETLCCKAVHDGRADYVLSSDSDCLAYRIPVWLRDYDSSTRTFRAVKLEDVLARVRLDETRFTDFCIMLGCDYNTRISHRKNGKVIQMGPVNCLSRIQAAPLDEIMKDESVDWSILNVQTCRSIFNLEIPVDSVSLKCSSELVC